ncbi:MAG: TonB-dependent receptor [Bacteroidales bacterium]|nr:TonB-dependent receptor [Bacteroidales bacterium]
MKIFNKIVGIVVLLAMSISVSAQNVTVKGNVKDASGVPVIGATVLQTGTTSNGTVTDIDGNYVISVPANANLTFTCIGYVDQVIAVAGKGVIDVVLVEDSEMLEETVVIGYGVQKKSDLTGAVASVKEGDLKNRSTSDAAAALQGKAAGIQIINASGAPGSGSEIRVRGYSSNSGNIGPLLIVDGLKVDNIQYLDPSMIESMEVLKDAASAAIYGAQAGNGVVLVTTKKGQEGHTSITYTGKAILESLGKKADIFRAADYIDYQTYIGNLTEEYLSSIGYDGTDTDWYDALFAPSWSQQHGLTFQGGNNKGHFMAALNYVNNDGIVRGNKDVYTRLTAQINADYQIFKWFNISTSNSIEKWSRTSVSSGYQSTLNSVVSIDPLTPVYYKTLEEASVTMQEHAALGEYIPRDPNHNNDYYGASKIMEEATGNPLWQRDRTDSSSEGFNIRGNISGNLNPIKGLTITSRLGYRIAQNNSHSYSAPYYLNSMAKSTTYSISANVNTNYYYQWENFANYNKSFGKHNIGAMVGMSYTESHNDNASLSSSGENILKGYEPNFRYINYLTSDANKSMNNEPGMSAELSYFGRLIYSYDNRYSVQANFRADAYDSSKLSAKNRWGYFPSISAGWTISNEPFFKDNVSRDAVSFLKLRGSWGRNGNVNILNGYRYSTSIALNSEMYQYNPSLGNGQPSLGSKPTGLANPDLKWETSEQIDLGLDARFLRDRLTVGIDWYKKTTKDLLIQVSPLPEIGVSTSWVNAGNVLNTGFEFELGWRDNIGDFQYSISANASTLHNEVLEVHSLLNRIDGSGISGLNNKLNTAFESGYPIWYFRGFKYAGVDQETGGPLYYNAKGEKVSTVSDNDKQYLGEGIPNFTYGITINLAYKGFDFTLFGTGASGNEIYNIMVSADRPKVNCLDTYWKNSWGNPSVDKASAKYPDMKQVATKWDFFSSSACVFDGSFFKIKQIQLGYTIPVKITKKALINDLRIYASLDDYFTFTKYPGADPETSSYNAGDGRGMDSGSYPTTKKAVFGINLTF